MARAEVQESACNIAKCPEHGLHGERNECFVCGGPVEQVPMVPLAVAEKLATALEEIAALAPNQLVGVGYTLLEIERNARNALAEFRAAHPREEATG